MKFTAIGLMSGTSLDGIDIAYCIFENKDSVWSFEIAEAQTESYSSEWLHKLHSAPDMDSQYLIKTHIEYGHYLAEVTNDFIQSKKLNPPDLIASHGHTIFHQPKNGFTFQIGDGSAIAAKTRNTVVCDFRSMSVACGGQGAPLVPIGDEMLFGKYDYCLNLGGFANISFISNNQRLAFDICPVNYVINYLVKSRQHEALKMLNLNNENEKLTFDPYGKIASKGKVSSVFLDELNEIDFYKKDPPKSLGAEWVSKNMIPVIEKYNNLPLQDTLRTYYEHIACQMKKITDAYTYNNILVTGGGAYNSFLIELCKKNISVEIVIPENRIIDYKEALIFAFLGVLRINKIVNILKYASGGVRNIIGGAVYEGS